MKRDKYDTTFSLLIRERDDYTCQRCGKQAKGQGMHCSHFYSRRHQSTRYAVDNACAHCFGCHQYLGGNPIEFQAWIRQYLGDTRYEMLRDRHNQIKKWLRGEKDEMNRHYKAELKRIQELRMKGEEGVLHVVDWE